MSELGNDGYGRLEYKNGELCNDAKVNDPTAYRGGSAVRSLVKWTGDDTSHAGRQELVLSQFKRDERFIREGGYLPLVGETTLHLRAPGASEAGTLIQTVRFDGVTYHVPIIAAAGLTIGPPELLRSADGRFRLHLQGDGNLVLYDDARSEAYWASNTVRA